MTTGSGTTLVENGHGLVGRTRLNLHKVRPRVCTLGARFVDSVNVLPGSGTPKHVVEGLQFGVYPVRHTPLDGEDVRTRHTRKSHTLEHNKK